MKPYILKHIFKQADEIKQFLIPKLSSPRQFYPISSVIVIVDRCFINDYRVIYIRAQPI